jgi:inositol-phosphate phosphatase / L-galactose 1-phosphate phosphatase / histidinol-phosphatase
MPESLALSNFLPTAHRMADVAGGAIRRYFRAHAAVEDKADASPVTIADKEAEKLMRELLAVTYPKHAVLGEEHGEKKTDSDYLWVLDPIDGTKNFMTGQPNFGTLIALLHHQEPVIGIINQPITEERWVGVKNGKTTMNGAVVKVRPCVDIAQAFMSTTSPYLFEGAKQQAFERVREKVKFCVFGSDCYAYAMLASGHLDLVVESGLKAHDVMALLPVLQGAGAIVTDWQGSPIIMQEGDIDIVASSSSQLHEQVLKLLE